MKKILSILFLLFLSVPLFAQDFGNVFLETQAVYQLIEKKDYQEAIRILDSLVRREPDYVVGLNLMGYCQAQLGHPQKAEFYYRRSDTVSPNLDARLGIQKALLAQKRYDESIKAGIKALELNPESYWAYVRLGTAYSYKKDYQKASQSYQQIMETHGETADLLWRQGLNHYYAGQPDRGIQLMERGYKKNPDHRGIRYSLGLPPYQTALWIIPSYSKYSFSGSSLKSGGEKFGLGLYYQINDRWSVHAGAYQDTTQSLGATSQNYLNYIFNEYNLLQYAQYTNSSYIYSYLQAGYNLYQFYNIATSEDYITHHYNLGVSFKPSFNYQLYINAHRLISNDSYTKGGGSVEVGAYIGSKNKWHFALAGITFPKHSGTQLTVGYHWNFLPLLWSKTGLTGQVMKITTQEYYLYSINPVYTYPYNETSINPFGSLRQDFVYTAPNWSLGVYGRLGESYTPIIMGDLVYNPSTMRSGFGSYFGFHYSRYSLSVSFGQDKWKNSLDENVSSYIWSFKFSVRLP